MRAFKLSNDPKFADKLKDVIDLQAAVHRFIAETNDDPQPFVWTAKPDAILAAVKRGRETLESIH